MNRLSFIYLLLIGLLVASCKPAYQTANARMELGEFNQAIPLYQAALAKSSHNHEKGKIHFLIGECYRLSNRLPEALEHYEKALEEKYYDDKLAFHYGQALKAAGRYEEAEKQFSGFSKTGSEYALVQRAKNELMNMEKIDSLAEPNEFVKLTNLGNLNSEASDYSPTFYKDKLVFTSTRRNEEVYESTGGGYADLYYFTFTDKEAGTGAVSPLNKAINKNGLHEASAVFSKDGTTMIFARSNTGSKDEKVLKDVNLYESRFEDGEWSEAKLLTNVTKTDAWDGCPALSADGKTLYFASDRSGGYGGLDLYSSKKDDRGEWGRPKNMGRVINTPGNDMFPYVSPESKLYFSSDGHPGIGSLDIFEAERVAGQITIRNLGAPYNSAYDDFSLIYSDEKTGYFTSNRSDDNAKGDDDIYSFVDETPEIKIIRYYLEGVTYQKTEQGEQKILPDVKVELKNVNGEVIQETISGNDGKFKFEEEIAIDEDFEVIGKSNDETHYDGEANFSTKGKAIDPQSFEEKEKDVTFETSVRLDYKAKEFVTLDETGEADFLILYDLGKYNIRPDAAETLDKVVTYMQKNETVILELGSHTDIRGRDDTNQILSENRAKAAVDYIVSKGISRDRLTAKGYGESDPIEKNARTEADHQKNRRTTIKNLKSKKKKDKDD